MQHSENGMRTFFTSPNSVHLPVGFKEHWSANMSLLEVILVALSNHQPVLEGKLLLNNLVFPC